MFNLSRIKRTGNYGFIISIKFGSMVLVGIKRTREYEEVYFLNRRLLQLKLSSRFAAGKILNQQFSLYNSTLLKRLSSSEDKRILFVIDNLEKVGGVETRLTSQFAYLSTYGWQPMLLHSGINQCSSLQKYPNFMLKFDAPDFMTKLLDIVRLSKVMVVEFQFKAGNPPRFFHDMDMGALGQLARTGCCIHGKDILKDKNSLDCLDYRLTPHKYKLQHSVDYMPNWVEKNENVWSFSHQKMALFVSRIDEEKLPTLINFVRLCKKYGVDYHIAGSVSQTKVIRNTMLRDGISESAFLGPIETLDFLKKHTDRYLFVGGVGQVPLEAGVLGYPALVVTHKDNQDISTFLTKETFSFLRDWNFVIRRCPLAPCLGNMDSFFEKCRGNDLSDYRMHEHIISVCGGDIVLQNYMIMLENIRMNQFVG